MTTRSLTTRSGQAPQTVMCLALDVLLVSIAIMPKVRADPAIIEPRIDAREGIPVVAPTAVRVLGGTENDKTRDDLRDIRGIQ